MERAVLIVEDDAAIGSGLERVLSGQGYEASHVACGADALRVVTGDVGLVILDLGLPDIDGIDVCRRIRAERPEIAILILTARDREIDVVAGLDAGADDYLVKPFRLSELLARVRAHLRRADRGRQRRRRRPCCPAGMERGRRARLASKGVRSACAPGVGGGARGDA